MFQRQQMDTILSTRTTFCSAGQKPCTRLHSKLGTQPKLPFAAVLKACLGALSARCLLVRGPCVGLAHAALRVRAFRAAQQAASPRGGSRRDQHRLGCALRHRRIRKRRALLLQLQSIHAAINTRCQCEESGLTCSTCPCVKGYNSIYTCIVLMHMDACDVLHCR